MNAKHVCMVLLLLLLLLPLLLHSVHAAWQWQNRTKKYTRFGGAQKHVLFRLAGFFACFYAQSSHWYWRVANLMAVTEKRKQKQWKIESKKTKSIFVYFSSECCNSNGMKYTKFGHFSLWAFVWLIWRPFTRIVVEAIAWRMQTICRTSWIETHKVCLGNFVIIFQIKSMLQKLYIPSFEVMFLLIFVVCFYLFIW